MGRAERKIQDATGGIFCIFHLLSGGPTCPGLGDLGMPSGAAGAAESANFLIIISNWHGERLPFIESVATTIATVHRNMEAVSATPFPACCVLERYQPSRLLIVDSQRMLPRAR